MVIVKSKKYFNATKGRAFFAKRQFIKNIIKKKIKKKIKINSTDKII
jgi:hypothetical protein